MRMRFLPAFAAVLISGVIISTPAGAHKISSKDEVYFPTPVFTERSWVESEAWLELDLRDRNEPSRPNPAVGFYPDLGLELSLWGLASVRTHVPMWINHWSEDNNTPDEVDDFFVPNWFLGLKLDVAGILGQALGDSMPKWIRLALDYQAGIPASLGTEGRDWFDPTNPTAQNEADQGDMIHQVRFLAGVTFAKFSLQLETGINHWGLGEDSYVNRYDVRGTATANTLAYDSRLDFVYNLALPYVFRYEGTVLMLELNGMATKLETSPLEGSTTSEWKHQLFLTPGVTFAPGSSFTLAFGFQIPLVDDMQDDNFRFLFNLRYSFSIKGVTSPFWVEEEKEGEKEGEEKKEEKKEEAKPPAEDKKEEAKPPAEDKKEEAKPPADEKKEQAKPPADEKKEQAKPPADEKKEQAKPPADEKKEQAKPPADEKKEEAKPPADEKKDQGA